MSQEDGCLSPQSHAGQKHCLFPYLTLHHLCESLVHNSPLVPAAHLAAWAVPSRVQCDLTQCRLRPITAISVFNKTMFVVPAVFSWFYFYSGLGSHINSRAFSLGQVSHWSGFGCGDKKVISFSLTLAVHSFNEITRKCPESTRKGNPWKRQFVLKVFVWMSCENCVFVA